MKRIFHDITVLTAVVSMGCVCISLATGVARAESARPELHIQPAERLAVANRAMMLSASLTEGHIVAVGERGVVLLSDDSGKTFRQARSVPVSSTLTGVSFVDRERGWAVGQWGVVLRTLDAGETWSIQRWDTSVDQPLFSVYFKNANEGFAVGLWSLMLHTADGGATWSTVQLPPPPGAKKADRNLYRIFADAKGDLFVTCEQGRVMRSSDGGVTWTYVETGYTGSFWSGIALQDGTLLVGGLRGTIYRSLDDGKTWLAAHSLFKSSVTDMLQRSDRSILAVALDGVSLVSHDDGVSFTGSQRPDRVPLTAVVDTPAGVPVLFSANGPIH